MRVMGMSPVQVTAHESSGMDMEEMARELQGKTGDEFDKNFIRLMSEHHRGAVKMAELAQDQAQHDEIKKLADDIISAQQHEMEQMHDWMHDWGYEE
jgi:uncharacterized protein (DUF305 family)